MKKFTAFLLMIACSMAALAQSYSVQCLVNDSEGEGVPFATIYVYNSNDTATVISSGVSDAFGKVNHSISKPGSYVLKVNFVGMTEEKRNFEVSKSQPTAQLGTIVLSTSATMLKEVVVSTQRQLVKTEIDRLSYDVQADADSKTNNVLDMLKKVPMVTVDGQDEIRVKGTTSFKVYRNGHPDPALSGQNMKEILKAVPASMIKKIEVITDPGAKYDAEGTSAILNIVMADFGGGGGATMNGVTGTVGAGVNNTGSINGNANITAQVNKVVASLNYGYHGQNRHGSHNLSESEYTYANTGNVLSTDNDSRASVNVHYGELSASWEPDTINLVSLSFGGFYYDYHGDGINHARMTDASGNVLYRYTTNGHAPKGDFYDLHGRLDYQRKLRNPGELLTLSYMLSTNHNAAKTISTFSDMLNCPFPYTGQTNDTKENFAEHTFQLDWTRPFAKYHQIETGVKYINRLNKSEAAFDYTGMPEMNNTTLFNHRTHVAAAYLSYRFSKNNWTTRAGLRYEYSRLNAEFPDGKQENYHRNLSDLVPDLSVEYKFDWAHSLKINYSTTIQRPGISYLNPAVDESPTSRSFGNPHLSSSRNHSITMTYMQIGSKLTFSLSPSISFSTNQITGVQYTEGDIFVSTYANTLKSRNLGLSGFMQWTISKNTSFTFNGNVGHSRYKSDELGLENKRWNSFFYAQLNQQLPWKLRLSVSGGEWSGGISGLYGYYTGSWFYNLGLQRSFLKEDRLTVRLSADNFLNSSKFNTMKSYISQGDYTGWSKNKWLSRGFRISVSYRFGSLKAHVKHTDKTIENNDVVGGSQQGGAGGSGGTGGSGGQQGTGM
ncbi:MAG: outer membrane beta-barrel protein [Muribaculaceae bacterium]|nr:outer membrane beta-barrel protein [Muribaculaceae bacterium]